MNYRSFSMMAIAVYAGFNAALLLVAGLLMTFSRQLTVSAGWRIPLGLVILTAGILLGAAIHGLWTRREWGRKILRWVLLFCIPLNAAAIFPIFQNHRMTTGNTVLQIACMLTSAAVVLIVAKRPVQGVSIEAADLENSPTEEDRYEEDRYADEDDGAFTFDRMGRADRLSDDREGE